MSLVIFIIIGFVSIVAYALLVDHLLYQDYLQSQTKVVSDNPEYVSPVEEEIEIDNITKQVKEALKKK